MSLAWQLPQTWNPQSLKSKKVSGDFHYRRVYQCLILQISDILSPQPVPKKDNIRIRFHPHSGRKTEIKSFETYGTESSQPRASHSKPWLPFHLENEFAFAKLMLESALSNNQVDSLIKVVQNLIGGEAFAVKDSKELETLWEGASDPLAPVCLLTQGYCRN
jgi:hypothetical protein